jgi:hypothetical protein
MNESVCFSTFTIMILLICVHIFFFCTKWFQNLQIVGYKMMHVMM